MKKIKLLVVFFLFAFIVKSNAQKTPEELGTMAFFAFQKDSLENFFRLKPSFAELKKFGQKMGIDSLSDQFKDFEKRYPLVIEFFKKKCSNLLNDTLENKFSWKNANLQKVEKRDTVLLLNNSDTNSLRVTITIVDIHFTSEDKNFILRLGDTFQYGEIWKPGNNIELIRVKNTSNGG